MPAFDDLRLETPRLVLRPPRAEDFDAWTAMMLDEPTARFIGGVLPRPLCWRQLMTMIGAWHSQGFAMFSVIERETGRWIIRLGPWQPDGWPGFEIGWAIVRGRWGSASSAGAYQWAELMRRTFGVDVLACPRRGGRLRLVALIKQASVIQRILRNLGLPTDLPEPRPARAPLRRLDFTDDQPQDAPEFDAAW